jgi:ATP-dependent helicase/nuclease subunit B
VAVAPQPVHRPRPAAPDLLPGTLSASACEALRTCPYQFFALRMLKLRESPELDEDVEKSDYGIWLHAVLERFHAERVAPAGAEAETARLLDVARAVEHELHLEDPSFLPYAASFARVAPRYVDWLHARDRQGARWLEGEKALQARPPAWGGTTMDGRIDRIDRVPGEDGAAAQLIDYKTSASQKLRERVLDPQEDTQLPFYAALVAAQPEAPVRLRGAYLPLDDADRLKEVEHPDVAASGERLVAGIGGELARLRAGAPLPALGEGAGCDWCAARGLCRRDHWADEEAP